MIQQVRCKLTAPSFGVAGTKTPEYCAQHAPDEMVDTKSRIFRTQGCGKGPSFGVAGTTTAEYCAQRARLQFDVEKYRDREVGPHHFCKETIGNAVPSGANHTTVHPPPTRQAKRRVLARTLISEYDTQMLRLRCRSELSHESPRQDR